MSHGILKYCLSKYKRLFPLIFVSVILNYCLIYLEVLLKNGICDYLKEMTNVPFEILMLSCSYKDACYWNRLAPLWFCSSLFICFPLFCILVLKFGRFTKIIIGGYIVSFVYGYWGIKDSWLGYKFALLRCFIALVVGMILWEISKKQLIKKKNERLRVIMVLLLFLGAIIITYYNYVDLNRYVLLAFCGIILISNRIKFSSVIAEILGDMSIYIFLLQQVIAVAINQTRLGTLSDRKKVIIWYLLCMIVSLVLALCKRFYKIKNANDKTKRA